MPQDRGRSVDGSSEIRTERIGKREPWRKKLQMKVSKRSQEKEDSIEDHCQRACENLPSPSSESKEIGKSSNWKKCCPTLFYKEDSEKHDRRQNSNGKGGKSDRPWSNAVQNDSKKKVTEGKSQKAPNIFRINKAIENRYATCDMHRDDRCFIGSHGAGDSRGRHADIV